MTATAANRSVSRHERQSESLDEPLAAKTSQRNGQATRQRILDAAFVEFAAAGLAGARVDRIAANAGCNKSLIFVYFQSKAALFETVVSGELERINRETWLNAKDPVQLAAKLFDFSMGHPQSMRLLAWYGLEIETDSRPKLPILPADYCLEVAPASPNEQTSGSFPAGFLPTAIIALSTACSGGNLLGEMLAPSEYDEPGRLRDAVLEGVKRLVE